MRGAGFGLIGLLLVGGIIFWITWGGPGTNGGTVRTDLEARQHVEDEVRKLNAQDSNGELVTKTIHFEAGSRGVVIDSVEPGSPFDKKYGLKPNDVILEIGPLSAKEQASDDKSADAFLRDAFARNEQLVVQRGGQRLTLPDQRDAAPAVPQPQAQVAPTPAAADTNPPPQPKRQSITGAAHDLVNQIQTH